MKRHLALAVAVLSGSLLAAPIFAQDATTMPATAATESLPPADPLLEPLSFMAGSWYSTNANGSKNREHWTTPRGKIMTGIFQQIRRDGASALYELSAIEVEEGRVVLRLRHFHRLIEIDDKRPHAEIYTLAETGPQKAVFKPSADPSVPREKGVSSITYRLDEQGRLVQEIRYENGSPEQDYVGVSSRE
jgi:hypothetical protein